VSNKVTERVFTSTTPSKRYFAHYLGVSNTAEEANINKIRNQSRLGYILGGEKTNEKAPKNVNKLIEHAAHKRQGVDTSKRSLTPIDYIRKSNIVYADSYNAHIISNEDNKNMNENNDQATKQRWEEEVNKIMLMVREHKIKEKEIAESNKARINGKRNGYIKKSLTPKITGEDRVLFDREVTTTQEDANEDSSSIFFGVGQNRKPTITKTELAKEYNEAIKQAKERKLRELNNEKREDQERLESVMMDHQRKLIRIAEMKKVIYYCII